MLCLGKLEGNFCYTTKPSDFCVFGTYNHPFLVSVLISQSGYQKQKHIGMIYSAGEKLREGVPLYIHTTSFQELIGLLLSLCCFVFAVATMFWCIHSPAFFQCTFCKEREWSLLLWKQVVKRKEMVITILTGLIHSQQHDPHTRYYSQ